MQSSSGIEKITTYFRNNKGMYPNGSKNDWTILVNHYKDLNYPNSTVSINQSYIFKVIKQQTDNLDPEAKLALAMEAFDIKSLADEFGRKYAIDPDNVQPKKLMPISGEVNLRFISIFFTIMMEDIAIKWHEKQK